MARQQLAERLSNVANHAAERERLGAALAEKEADRGRITTLHRRGRLPLAEAEHRLDDIAREAALLRSRIDALVSEDEMARVYAARSIEVEELLTDLGREVDEIERMNDFAKKRRIVEALVGRIEVDPEGQQIDGRVRVIFRFGAPAGAGGGSDFKDGSRGRTPHRRSESSPRCQTSPRTRSPSQSPG
ncbi:MAG: hypothetical protein FJ033_16920 [Chloroflexi bacterium]|nr:hypothetical protein [Chloroflexota bacterium]